MHNECDRLHNQTSGDYTKYSKKNDRYYGFILMKYLLYHLSNNDIFEEFEGDLQILVRYLMAAERANDPSMPPLNVQRARQMEKEIQNMLLSGTKSWLYSRCGDLQQATFVRTSKLDLIQSQRYFEKSLELTENNSDSHSWYADLLSQCFEDYGKCEKHFQLAISTSDAAAEKKNSRYKRTSMFYARYGMFLRERKKYQEAIKCFENTVKIAPKWKNYQYLLANSYYDSKDFRNALINFGKALNFSNVNDNGDGDEENNNNDNIDSDSQNRLKPSNLFSSYLKYGKLMYHDCWINQFNGICYRNENESFYDINDHSSFLIDGDDISKLISGYLRIEMTKLFGKLNYSIDNFASIINILINDQDNNMFFKWLDIRTNNNNNNNNSDNSGGGIGAVNTKAKKPKMNFLVFVPELLNASIAKSVEPIKENQKVVISLNNILLQESETNVDGYDSGVKLKGPKKFEFGIIGTKFDCSMNLAKMAETDVKFNVGVPINSINRFSSYSQVSRLGISYYVHIEENNNYLHKKGSKRVKFGNEKFDNIEICLQYEKIEKEKEKEKEKDEDENDDNDKEKDDEEKEKEKEKVIEYDETFGLTIKANGVELAEAKDVFLDVNVKYFVVLACLGGGDQNGHFRVIPH